MASQPIKQILFPADEEHPRITEGSVLQTERGLLLATTEFYGGGGDDSAAHIIGCYSTDGGITWGEAFELQENIGTQNVMSASLLRTKEDDLLLFYLIKNSRSDLDVFLKFSEDEGQTWGAQIPVSATGAYTGMCNDRAVQLSTGRILAPIQTSPECWSEREHYIVQACISDDGGRTWRRSKGSVDAAMRGAMEPVVVELVDGRILMAIRVQMGEIYYAYSDDEGETWSPSQPSGVRSPEAPCLIKRIPQTGDLLLVWNDTFAAGSDHGGQRRPLSLAISRDEGATFGPGRPIEDQGPATYSYPSLWFDGDNVILTYYQAGGTGDAHAASGLSFNVAVVPLEWIYEER